MSKKGQMLGDRRLNPRNQRTRYTNEYCSLQIQFTTVLLMILLFNGIRLTHSSSYLASLLVTMQNRLRVNSHAKPSIDSVILVVP